MSNPNKAVAGLSGLEWKIEVTGAALVSSWRLQLIVSGEIDRLAKGIIATGDGPYFHGEKEALLDRTIAAAMAEMPVPFLDKVTLRHALDCWLCGEVQNRCDGTESPRLFAG